MLRFFRTLRQRLLAENRFRKYLLYAIGEIVLVVIGILIALQINTWNEDRKLKAKEIRYLKEIRSNLNEDLARIAETEAFNQKKDSSIRATIQIMLAAESNASAAMEIIGHMNWLSDFQVFTQNRTAFDNMISAENIDLISEDSLRSLVSSYYAERDLLRGTQERIKELTRKFTDHISPLLVNKEVIGSFLGESENLVPAEQIMLRTDRTLLAYLTTMQMSLRAHQRYLEEYRMDIQLLTSRIEHFLNVRG